MSMMPRSLCAMDGSLNIPTDKTSLMHCDETVMLLSDAAFLPSTQHDIPQVLIIDAMTILQNMKKTPSMKTLSDLQASFIRRIESMMLAYSEGRIIFDRF